MLLLLCTHVAASLRFDCGIENDIVTIATDCNFSPSCVTAELASDELPPITRTETIAAVESACYNNGLSPDLSKVRHPRGCFLVGAGRGTSSTIASWTTTMPIPSLAGHKMHLLCS